MNLFRDSNNLVIQQLKKKMAAIIFYSSLLFYIFLSSIFLSLLTMFILKIKTSFEAYKRYIYVQI